MNTNAVNQVAENVSGYTESEKSSKVSGKTIGEPKLSDKAKEYYEKLKKKFSTMDFILVSKDMKETAKANAGQYANANKWWFSLMKRRLSGWQKTSLTGNSTRES